MFCRCFGNYLLGKNIITQEQLDHILDYRKSNRVKLGLIAVEQKLLTAAKAEEINHLQMKMDKRFGDIAIEKGYLTEEEVSKLLKLQGNPYLLFVQAVTEHDMLSKEKVDACLVGFQKDNGYNQIEMEALKNGEIDKIVTLLTKANQPYDELVTLVIKNLIRFVNTDIAIGAKKLSKQIKISHIAIQELQGDYPAMLALGCDSDELLALATPYGKEEFASLDADALDAVCEFINCTNGLYASKLSQENIELDMLPPSCKEEVTLTTEGEFFELDIQIGGKWIKLIIVVKSKWSLS
jgi:CheY-specific phosphatase CheX